VLDLLTRTGQMSAKRRIIIQALARVE
jgi:hypothetical protein